MLLLESGLNSPLCVHRHICQLPSERPQHNTHYYILQEEGLATLPGGRSLGQGDYRDIARSARRLVRQHGSGSVTKGLHTIKAQVQSAVLIGNT